MKKTTEIQVLQSLKGDTYFNQFFTSEMIDTMCDNIEKDFAIESGIGLVSKHDFDLLTADFNTLRNITTSEIKNLKDDKNTLIDTILKECDEECNLLLMAQVRSLIGLAGICLRKLKLGKPLTEEEIHFIEQSIQTT